MKLRKLMALLLCGMLVFCFVGCSENTFKNVMTIDGEEISGGFYMMAQQMASYDAKNLVEDSEKDYLKQKIDGVSAGKWIQERTEEWCRQHVLVRRMCRERSITMGEAEQQEISSVLQMWEYLGPVYQENGVSQETFVRFLTTESLTRMLFYDMYAEDGELYVTDEYLKEKYAEATAHVRYYNIPLGTPEEGVDTVLVTEMAETVLAGMKAGKSLEAALAEDVAPIFEVMAKEYDPATAADGISTSYIGYDETTNYTEEFLAQLKEQAVGDVGLYNTGTNIMLYEKIEAFTKEDNFEEMRDTVLDKVEFENFEAYLKEIYSAYPVSYVFGARSYYSPKKVLL